MLETIFSQLVDFLINTIGAMGYLGIFLLMGIESSFIPFPSEVVLIPAGILIATGDMVAGTVFFAAVAGSLLGSLFNYYVGYNFGRSFINKNVKKYGKAFFLTKEKIINSEKYFKSHGEITILIGRLIPGIRQLISIPAGFAKMGMSKFCLFTIFGAGLWSGILIYLGFLFGDNQTLIESNIDTITIVILAISVILMGLYIRWHVCNHKKNHNNT